LKLKASLKLLKEIKEGSMKAKLQRLYQTVVTKLRSVHYRVAIAIILVGVFGIYLLVERFSLDEEALYIGVVGPMGEPDGKAMVRGITLLLEEVNQKGGIHGKRVALLGFNDKNKPDLARQKAQEIADDKRVLVVLGHYYSSPSLAGGKIYQKTGIPAITASALANEVTEENNWYFRTTFSNRAQAAFLANYVKKILQHETASIVYSRDPYGISLKEDFQQVFLDIEGTIKHTWSYNPEAKELENRIGAIVKDLYNRGSQEDPGIIFLATREIESAKIVVAMKRKGLNYPIIGDDWAINEKFTEYSEERRKPGYFSDGIYTAIPIHFDFAGIKAQRFQEEFKKKYAQKPGIIAAMYYDAALVAVQAMKESEVQGEQKNLAEDRKNIRDYLASIRSINDAIQGISGPIYFDKDGSLAGDRSLTMGVFQNHLLTSALTQLTPIDDFNRIGDLEQEVEANRILLINNQYMYKTNLVHTGVEIHNISDLDIKDLSYDMDFLLWFRYQGQFDDNNIEFLNAVQPIQLEGNVTLPSQKGKPIPYPSQEGNKGVLVTERFKDGLTYRLYRVNGHFKADFLPGLRGFKQQHVLGISFQHRDLSRSNLIYVIDTFGMGLTDENSSLKKIQEAQVLSAASGWTINQARHFENKAEKSSRGDPLYLNSQKQSVDYSRFNTGIWIKKTEYFGRKIISILQGFIPVALTPLIVILSGIILLLLELVRRRKVHKRRILWLGQAVFLFCLFLVAEGFFVDWLGRKILSSLGATIYTYYLNITTLTFEILWFVFPAFLLTIAIEYFCWAFIEEHTGYVVPHVIRHFVIYIIYLLALFGIIAFVFGQSITTLAATSGIVAILIGFASKVDISNIFAGIGISLSQPFRIGDWVKVNDLEEGKVIDMTSRVTKIETRDRTMLSIPNTMVAGGVIENYNYPDKHYRIKFQLQIVPIYQYERVEKILLDAVLSTEGILKDPAPDIVFQGQGDSSAIFAVHFYVDDYSKRIEYKKAVWRRVWRHLERAGIGLATPRREVLMVEATAEDVTAPLTILRSVTIFQSLPDEAKTSLSEQVRCRHFASRETIFQQGESSDSLFIIVEGAVGMWLQFKDGKAIEVFRMGTGDFFGEMELLAGGERRGSAISMTDTKVFEIMKDDLAPFLEEYPQVSELLSKKMMKREADMESQTDLYQLEEIEKDAPSSKLLQKTKQLLGVKKS
jgi:branched-chain amino acid transport system substrate-binding protein